jgi:PAS domain-containing protein
MLIFALFFTVLNETNHPNLQNSNNENKTDFDMIDFKRRREGSPGRLVEQPNYLNQSLGKALDKPFRKPRNYIKFRSSITSCPYACAFAGENGCIVDMNKRFLIASGYTAKELFQMSMLQLIVDSKIFHAQRCI